MKLSQVQVSVAKTINLGDYNSLRIQCTATFDMAEGDTVETASPEMQATIKRVLDDTYKTQLRRPAPEQGAT